MTKTRSTLSLMILAVLAAGFFSFPAFAQSTVWAQGCSVDGTLAGLFCSLSTEFRFVPKALSLVSYAMGVTFFLMALLGWIKYGDDPGQTSVRDLIMKMIVGAFLISLPLGMQVVVKSVIGKGMSDAAQDDLIKRRPCTARSSSAIDGGTQKPGC